MSSRPLQLKVYDPVVVDRSSEEHIKDGPVSISDAGVRGYPHAARFSDGTIYAHFYVSPWRGRLTVPVSCVSRDEGATWSRPRRMPVGPASEPVMLRDDTLLYFNEIRIHDSHRFTAHRCETRDRGESFEEIEEGAEFRLPSTVAIDRDSPQSYWGQCESFVYQYGFLREGDTVWATVGAHCKDRPWLRLMLFRSDDEAVTFSYVSTIAGEDYPGHGGYSEPVLRRMTDGSLLAIARTEYPPDDWRYMQQFRSVDDGVTWVCEGVPLGVPPVYRIRAQRPIRNDGKTHASAGNVSPALCVLDNGVAALAFGRPGLKVVFSADGTGRVWTDALRMVPEESLFGRNDSSSGMSGIVPVSEDQFVLVYDVGRYRERDGDDELDTIFSLRIAAHRYD